MRNPRKRAVALAATTALVLSGAVAATANAPDRATHRTAALGVKCPNPSALFYPHHPKRAVPAARRYLREHGASGSFVVRDVSHARGSFYAAAIRSNCGRRVLHYSVYVQLHPRGFRCVACDLHAYVVRRKAGFWKVWVNF